VLSLVLADDAKADIVINAFSMGVLHRAVPMTVGLCLGVATRMAHTLAWDILEYRRSSNTGDLVRIRHPGGVVEVGAELGSGGEITRVANWAQVDERRCLVVVSHAFALQCKYYSLRRQTIYETT